MNIIAHMMCRNEFDVIEETVSEIMRWVDTLIVLDGDSTDGTCSLLHDLSCEYEKKNQLIEVHSEPDPGGRFTDHVPRTRLLELTKPHKPDWVISVDADEIYHYDPNQSIWSPMDAIVAAVRADANVVRSWVPQFWLTFDDLRKDLLQEDETISVQQRRRWYSWGYMGTFIWRWNDAHYYPTDVPKRTPELPGQTWREWQRAGPVLPVCKHYCIRSVPQAAKRAEERRERGGRKYFGKYFGRVIMDAELAKLHYLGEDEEWQTGENHEAVTRYMAGDH